VIQLKKKNGPAAVDGTLKRLPTVAAGNVVVQGQSLQELGLPGP
jgi:hypothetical protein